MMAERRRTTTAVGQGGSVLQGTAGAAYRLHLEVDELIGEEQLLNLVGEV
jgi:hypothetical protein